MIGALYRGLTRLAEPLVTPFLPADRREPLPRVAGGAWLHAASAGEVRGVVTLARRGAALGPVLVTAQTAAGVSAARRFLPEAAVRRARLDFPGAVAAAVRQADPGLYVLAETELWPNLLDALARAGVPRVLVNARISDRTIGRYRRLSAALAPRLAGFALVAAQSDMDAARLVELGVRPEALVVTGNMKHDLGGAEVRPLALPWGDAPVVTLGSLRPGEAELLAPALAEVRAAVPALRVIAAPRHMARGAEVARVFRAAGFGVAARSAGGPGAGDALLLLDTMGELAAAYAASRVAFVGGTLRPYGGHNIVEPAAVGVGVIHGPFVSNCRAEAQALAACGGARVADERAGLAAAFRELLSDEAARTRLAGGARAAVARLAGATDRVVGELERRGLWPPAAARRAGRP